MADTIINIDQLRGWLTYLKRAAVAAEPAGPLKTPVPHLFVNDFVPGPDSVLTDFTEATFDGYSTAIVVEYGEPIEDPDNQHAWMQFSAQFTATGGTVAETVYGWFVTHGGVVTSAARLDTPVPISDAGDGVIVHPRVRLPATQPRQ